MTNRQPFVIGSVLALFAFAAVAGAAPIVQRSAAEQLLQMRRSVPAVAQAATQPQRLAAIERVLENIRVIEGRWPSQQRVLATAYTEAADLLLASRMPSNALTYIHKGEAIATGVEVPRLWAREARAEGMLGHFTAASDLMDRALKHDAFAAMSEGEQRQTLSAAADVSILAGDTEGAAKLYRRIAHAAGSDHVRIFYTLMAARQSEKLADKNEAAADAAELDRAIADARRNNSMHGIDAQTLDTYVRQSAALHKKIGR